MILSNDYLKKVVEATHQVGGLVVLDCIASGTVWIDMKAMGVDVLISAPQKGWSGPACCGMVMLSETAVEKMADTKETSFALSLKKWCGIMDKYEAGAFGYHTTMPTDALREFHNVSVEMMSVGMAKLQEAQIDLGRKARMALSARGLVSVAAPKWEAPGVLVFYTPSGVDSMTMVKAFKQHGVQIAAGVPWEIDEPKGVQTFRIGLFGLDKLKNVDETVRTLEMALDKVLEEVSK
jgi:aspartate aminotransferase-like enzyme